MTWWDFVPKTWSDLRDGVETLGLVGAGVWAAWTFHKLQKVRAAEIQNRKGILEIRRARLSEQELRTRLVQRQPVLQIGLRVEEESEQRPTSFLRITVTLANRGDQNLKIQFNEAFLTIGQVTEGQGDRLTIKAVHRLAPWLFDKDKSVAQPMPEQRIFRVGQKRHMSFAVPVHAPGAYVVQCRTAYFRIPFDGEADGKSPPFVIDAIEQVACVIKGGDRALREPAAPGPSAVPSPPALVDKPTEANP
jgi:hypothetical protein